jgi:hypothetical protein
MKPILAFSLAAWLTLGSYLFTLRASDSVPPASAPREVGRVLVLDNERTLTGDIERVGPQYRIKRLVGETWIPAENVIKLCASLEDAYQFLKRRANLHDADERLRLADWCRQHALLDQAIDEANEASKLRPQDERIRRLHNNLQQAKTRKPTAPATPEPDSPRVEVSAESLGLFASKIQPVLMNACANCHTGGRGGSFQLVRVSTPGLTSRRSTERNIAAALAQLNGKEPGLSKLLQKAISVHGPGMSQAPLKSRDATPFRLLEQWVARTIETNPYLREETNASLTQASFTTRSRGESGTFGKDRDPAPLTPPVPPTTTREPAPVKEKDAPKAKPASEDPVDPEAFNREFHPKRETKPPPR